MSKSPIEWTEETWNPIVGCSIVSPGCTNCYAMKTAARNEAMGISRYDGTTRKVNGNTVWTGKLAQAPVETLLAPLKRKKPTTYFVNSMGDLFHEDVPDEWIDRVFAVMALCPQHTFQVLTKRAKRMQRYIEDSIGRVCAKTEGDWPGWPLPNVWLGVSAEDQCRYDERKELLRATPAAVRFFSMEPLLGPIVADYLGDWVIVGGESGPNARPMHPDWARSQRDQCAAAGVAYFFKQWGSFLPIIDRDNDDPDFRRDYTRATRYPDRFKILNLAGGCGFHGERVHLMLRCNKKAAGRLLDGTEHNAMPARP